MHTKITNISKHAENWEEKLENGRNESLTHKNWELKNRKWVKWDKNAQKLIF